METKRLVGGSIREFFKRLTGIVSINCLIRDLTGQSTKRDWAKLKKKAFVIEFSQPARPVLKVP